MSNPISSNLRHLFNLQTCYTFDYPIHFGYFNFINKKTRWISKCKLYTEVVVTKLLFNMFFYQRQALKRSDSGCGGDPSCSWAICRPPPMPGAVGALVDDRPLIHLRRLKFGDWRRWFGRFQDVRISVVREVFC